MTTLLRTTRKLHSLRPSASSSLTPQSQFLLLPSSLRTRAFHASPRPQLIAEAVQTSHYLLETLHSATNLPWAYTLPLFAVLVRTTLFLPLSIYTRRIAQKQISLSPIVSSWTHVLRKEAIHEAGHLGPMALQKRLLLKVRGKRGEIFKRWHCQTWKSFAPVLQIPVFLSVMEAVRQMCGTHNGFLGMMMRSSEGEVGSEAVRAIIPIDPSLALEGALWFPDLLVADPQLALPFILSGTILLNIMGHRARKDLPRSKFVVRIEKGLAVAALAIGPLMLHMPSALLVYWIGSSLSAWVQTMLLDKLMPFKKPVAACKPKRPWRTGLGAELLARMGKGEKGDEWTPRAANPDAIAVEAKPRVRNIRRQRGI